MKEVLKNDIIKAMREKDKEKLSVLRMLKGAIQLEEINKKQELNEEDLGLVVTKQIKTRKESVEQFENANRFDLSEKTKKEIDILSEYLPKQLTTEEIKNIIDEGKINTEANSVSDKGKLMKEIMPKLKGKADMKFVNSYVSEILN